MTTEFSSEEKKEQEETPKRSKKSRVSAPNKVTTAKESLIPLKGIDVERKKILNKIGIETVSDLLYQGRTISNRATIASKVMNLEREDITGTKEIEKWKRTYTKYVDSWVKQADLWRVSGMDEDTAFFLVELGIRHVEDLAKVDACKAYDIMQCLYNTQPDYVLISLKKLESLIKNAQKMHTRYPNYQEKLTSKISGVLTKSKLKVAQSRELLKVLSLINIEDIIGGSSIECDDPAPTFLFREEVLGNLVTDTADSKKVLKAGLGFLQDVEITLPLPKTIRGIVQLVSKGKISNFENVMVEISGISSPSSDKTENTGTIHTYTDGNGEFIVIMPDRYNMQESITITFSQGIRKQKFVLGASDIINHVTKQEVLKAFNQLDMVSVDLSVEQEKLDFINRIELEKEESYQIAQEDQERYIQLLPQKELIEEEVQKLKEKENELETFIKKSDDSTNDLNRILRNLTCCDNLTADFREEPFVINEEIFNGYKEDTNKVLPSVKLMESESETIYLPTDTAPSRVFNYSMLQRLVEPAISPVADVASQQARITLEQAVDVAQFKEIISTDPDKWPQMSSLGIGYVLNMHQAWIPDGFALGNLLYSLVLAPGEEQRLIVRENKQSYKIADTAEGSEAVLERYLNSQTDNTTATYEYALNQMLEGNSDYNYSAKASSFGGSFGASGFGAMLGLSASTSKTSGKASSTASQHNTHREVSNAAQNFQHTIKTSSDKVSQAKRLSISMGTNNEKDSVATRIIANHNHSHTMTIQYWEVMRRYCLETCVDSIDLVLFVPLKLINFLNHEEYLLDSATMTQQVFNKRYQVFLKYADVLEPYLPSKYKTGLGLIKRYAAYPQWTMQSTEVSSSTITLSFKGYFMECDSITATMILKNGKGRIAGNVSYEGMCITIPSKIETSAELKEAIKSIRNTNESNSTKTYKIMTCKCTFTMSSNMTKDDIDFIRLNYFCEDVNYVLYKNPNAIGANNSSATETYQYMIDKTWDLAKDRNDSAGDIRKIEYCKQMLPEAWLFPNVTISSKQMKQLGVPILSDFNIKTERGASISCMPSDSRLYSSINVVVDNDEPVLKYSEIQAIESTVHHVVSDTMRYSQVIWASLSSDERALMLEKYTINMDYSGISDQNQGEEITIPLLNCINVKKMLGFYGNCMLFPFTYPQKLADKIGKTAAELQDSLYRYHTNYFRVPHTTISLPTEGMIGEAVLGETNVSEEIDLTRFWNWKDSPINNMSIDSSYLNGNDYLAGKTTKDISALNLQGATSTTPVTTADLVSALVAKQTPTFDNITGLDQLKDILNTSTSGTAQGRDNVLSTSCDMAKTAMEYAYKESQLQHQKKDSNNNKSNGNQLDNRTSSDNGVPSGNEILSDNGNQDSDGKQIDNNTQNNDGINIDVNESSEITSDDNCNDVDYECQKIAQEVTDIDIDEEIDYDLLKSTFQTMLDIRETGIDPQKYIEQYMGIKMPVGILADQVKKEYSELGIIFEKYN